MEINIDKILTKFYRENKDLVNKYGKFAIKDCVMVTFNNVKQGIESGYFPNIRIKYFGTFAPSLLGMISFAEKEIIRFEEGKIDKETFESEVFPIYDYFIKFYGNLKEYYKNKSKNFIEYVRNYKKTR